MGMINFGMDEHKESRMRNLGHLVPMQNGDEAVPVSLHYRAPLKGLSVDERKKAIQSEFVKVAEELGAAQVEINLDTISFLGQSVSALIPLKRFDDIGAQLDSENIAIQIDTEETVI